MTSRDFAFWLQGFFEINEVSDKVPHGLSAQQVETIKRHLSLVFRHEIDPSFGGPEKQEELNKIHHIPLAELNKINHNLFAPLQTQHF